MASRFWAPVFISLAVLLASVGQTDPYGRYGFLERLSPPGFEFEDDGFRVSEPAGDKVYFAAPLQGFRPKTVNWQECLWQGRDFALTPGAIRTGGFQPGFELYFPLGMRLRFTSNYSPFLTWGEGTVDSDNPTPESRWVLLSFRDGQAPLLLVFDKPVQLLITGRSGSWTLATLEHYKGWVRVLTPFGTRRLGATAGALGEAVKEIRGFVEPLTRDKVQLVSRDVREDETGITVVWTFDRPGAALPSALLLAKAGGYPLQILTGVSRERLELPGGPVQWSTEPRIVVKFPVRRVPAGRALGLGEAVIDGPATASAFDLPSVVELGLANLLAGRDKDLIAAVDQVREEYERTLQLSQEPSTESWTPIGKGGEGADLVAAHAFLIESSRQSLAGASLENMRFEAVAERLDWDTWTVWGTNDMTRRRAGALLALAGAVSQDPERRLFGAMAQAGLAAQEALGVYQERRRFVKTAMSGPDPLKALRAALYRGEGQNTVAVPFVDSLMSPVRVLSPGPVVAERVTGGYIVSWLYEEGDPRSLSLLMAFPVEIEARANLAGIQPTGTLGVTTLAFEPREPGWCRILVKVPGWGETLPGIVPVPRYTE